MSFRKVKLPEAALLRGTKVGIQDSDTIQWPQAEVLALHRAVAQYIFLLWLSPHEGWNKKAECDPCSASAENMHVRLIHISANDYESTTTINFGLQINLSK